MARRLNYILLLIAIVLSLLSSMVIIRMIHSWKGQHTTAATAMVVVVTKAMAAHDVVDATDVALHAVPAAAVQPGTETSLAAVIGQYTATEWFVGQQVVSPMVVASTTRMGFPLTIPVGERAFTIADDAVTGVDHLLSIGDNVDVLVSFTDKNGAQRGAKVLLQDISVLSVDQAPVSTSTTATQATSTPSTTTQARTVDTITLAVTPAEASQLDFALAFGQLHIMLRNPKDVSVSPQSMTTSFTQLP